MWLNIDTKQKVCKYSILRLSYEIFSFWIFFLFLGIWLLSVWLAGWHFSIFTFVCVCDTFHLCVLSSNEYSYPKYYYVCMCCVRVRACDLNGCVCVVVCDPVHAQYLIKSYIQIEFESVMMKWYVHGCRSVLCVVCSVCFNGLSTSYQIPENRTNWYWSRRVETSYRLKWLLNE